MSREIKELIKERNTMYNEHDTGQLVKKYTIPNVHGK